MGLAPDSIAHRTQKMLIQKILKQKTSEKTPKYLKSHRQQ
jgi:hypothetical protein